MSQCSSNPTSFNPRSYQSEVFEVAKLRNTIAVLDTGAGKTLTAVMLIKHIGQLIKPTDEKRLVVFLAPTVHLVNQQFEVIRDHTDLAVEEYYGDKGIDDWNSSCWEKEIEEHDVMVMTPQILLDSLRKAFSKMQTVSLLVIDECHRASGSHPYVKIMKEYYHTSNNKPKIFGMTASPVIGKVVSSTGDCKVQLSRLESILDSQIFAIKDRKELDQCVPYATENCRFYNQAQFLNDDLKLKMEGLWSQFDASLLRLKQSVECQYKDIDDTLGKLRKRLSNDYSKILYCLDDLGPVCACEAINFCLENSPFVHQECEFSREGCFQYACFFNELLKLIGAYFNTVDKGVGICNPLTGEDYLRNRKQKNGSDCPAESTEDSFPTNECSRKICSVSSTPPVIIESIDIKKGGPRTSIYSTYKTLQWPLPKFICKETKSSTRIELGEGSGKIIGFNYFVSNIILQIPNSGIIECTGDAKADKKSSFDSAAIALLYELEKQQRIVIVKP